MEKCCFFLSVCDLLENIGWRKGMQDYIFSNDFFQNIDAMVYTCGYEACASSHSYGPAVRSGYLIHYVIDGKGIFKTNGKLYRLNAGDAFLIVPGSLIYYEADAKKPWTYTWIGFQGIKIKQYLERTSLMDCPVFHYGRDDRIRLCHEKMFEANQLQENKDLIMNSILYEYLFLLASKFPRQRMSVQSRKITYVEESLKYIESNYARNISIHEIAQFLNIDRSYLHRLFKQVTGCSLKTYLLNYRIKRACELLANTDIPVAVIARSVGYEDPFYFSRLFKNKKGVSPMEYRQKKGNQDKKSI